jgi:hypothetical protein
VKFLALDQCKKLKVQSLWCYLANGLSFLYAGIIDHTIWLNWFDHTQFNMLTNYCIYLQILFQESLVVVWEFSIAHYVLLCNMLVNKTIISCFCKLESNGRKMLIWSFQMIKDKSRWKSIHMMNWRQKWGMLLSWFFLYTCFRGVK